LFENPNYSITDIAFAVGFSDASYFGRIFKKHFGVSPSEKFSHQETNDDNNPSPTVELKIPHDLIRDVVA
jgi:AraC-like DNA-binding protein